MAPAGSVAEIWRYPVKSMGGERVGESAIDVRGLHADRMWAVRDVELGTFTTARRWPVLLRCSARFADDPAGRTAGPGDVLPVVITFPDGAELASSDPAVPGGAGAGGPHPPGPRRAFRVDGQAGAAGAAAAAVGQEGLPDAAGDQ